MHVIKVRNVHQALPEGLRMLEIDGVKRSSRAGDVLEVPYPVATVFTHPRERVIFHTQRDANPTFHLFESIWMLAGRNDLAWIEPYLGRMREFSDDGLTLRASYGHRSRATFTLVDQDTQDQFVVLSRLLRQHPDTRRAVMQFWDCELDLFETEDTELGITSKDVPCNLVAHFYRRDDRLDMVIFCRSNDAIWGAYGTNAVHFSMFQEYLAAMVGIEVGTYTQISSSFHAYVDVFEKCRPIIDGARDGFRRGPFCPYTAGIVRPYPLIETNDSAGVKMFDDDLSLFMSPSPAVPSFKTKFFSNVVWPIHQAHAIWKNKDNPHRFQLAKKRMCHCDAMDWQKAGLEWLERRRIVYERARDDGPSYEEQG